MRQNGTALMALILKVVGETLEISVASQSIPTLLDASCRRSISVVLEFETLFCFGLLQRWFRAVLLTTLLSLLCFLGSYSPGDHTL
jgi:hypothetical protein